MSHLIEVDRMELTKSSICQNTPSRNNAKHTFTNEISCWNSCKRLSRLEVVYHFIIETYSLLEILEAPSFLVTLMKRACSTNTLKYVVQASVTTSGEHCALVRCATQSTEQLYRRMVIEELDDEHTSIGGKAA